MDAYQYGNGFARLVQALKARGGADLRAELTRQARASLAGNRRDRPVPGVPAQRPGPADSQFVGQGCAGSNDSGRFSLYWSQPSPGALEPRPCRNRCSATPASAQRLTLQPLADLPAGHRQGLRARAVLDEINGRRC
jgi:hypothetical protein